MSFFERNKEKIQKGFEGESRIRDIFLNKKIPFMQVDLMFYYKNQWCIAEVKTQEKFLAPPFDGHGLPPYQLDRRMQLYKDTGIIPYLIINCLTDDCVYIETLENLLKGEYFETKGNKKRIIFNIDSFKKL
jgi:hypothetical protein